MTNSTNPYLTAKAVDQEKNGSPRCAGLRHFCGSDRIRDGHDVFAGENAVRRDGYADIRRASDAGLSHSSPRIPQSLRVIALRGRCSR